MSRRRKLLAITLLGIGTGACSEEKAIEEREAERTSVEERRERERIGERQRRGWKQLEKARRRELERIPALAASCAKILSSRDPRADARTAFAAGERRLLSWTSNGWSPTAPGIEECDPKTRHDRPRGLPPLPLGLGATNDYAKLEDALWQPCWNANQAYASAFNLEILKLAPGAIEISCRARKTSAEGPAPAVAGTPLQDLAKPDDYPASALRRREAGIVQVRLSVDADGRVGRCQVIKSSRSASLDAATCRILRSRARFHPARNEAGAPIASSSDHSQWWQLPE